MYNYPSLRLTVKEKNLDAYTAQKMKSSIKDFFNKWKA